MACLHDIQDVFYRLFELTVTLSAKSNDIGLWNSPTLDAGSFEDILSIDTISSLSKDRPSGKVP